jgi:hypothetical protein
MGVGLGPGVGVGVGGSAGVGRGRLDTAKALTTVMSEVVAVPVMVRVMGPEATAVLTSYWMFETLMSLATVEVPCDERMRVALLAVSVAPTGPALPAEIVTVGS